MPDVNRGSRYILKDYVNGKLLYCYPPPNVEAVSFQEHRYEISKEIKYMEKAKKLQQRVKFDFYFKLKLNILNSFSILVKWEKARVNEL